MMSRVLGMAWGMARSPRPLIASLGTLIGLLLPAVQAAREAARISA
jgi:hypothetical protein